MRITFTRHGQSTANILRLISNRGLTQPLTRTGREQAAALADKLQGRMFPQEHAVARIFTSPLLRAVETAIIVASRLDVDYEVADGLREFDCGNAEGRADADAWQMWQELVDDWTVHGRWERRIEGGESFHDLRDRFVPFVEGMVAEYRGTDAHLLCVSHGGTLWMMLPLVLANVDHDLMSKHGFANTVCIVSELRPDGLRCVEWDGAKI